MMALTQKMRQAWTVFRSALKIFMRVDGAHWAGAFAFNALLSLLPLVILCISISTVFINQERAGREIIGYMESYTPISGDMQGSISAAISEVVTGRAKAGVIASLFLVWAALHCFTTLICAINHAWGDVPNSWWRLPLKSLAFLGITGLVVILGAMGPILLRLFERLIFAQSTIHSWFYGWASLLVPLLVGFIGLTLLYKLAPRHIKRLSEVYTGALYATIMLFAAKMLFAVYLDHFATLHAVYGVFSGLIAALMWIYVSGCIVVFGACLCAAQNEQSKDASINQKEKME